MHINIYVDTGDHEGPIRLGCMEPPQELLLDSRSGDEGFWQQVIHEEYERFKQQNPEPDSDDEFLAWLSMQGWQETAPQTIEVTIE